VSVTYATMLLFIIDQLSEIKFLMKQYKK